MNAQTFDGVGVGGTVERPSIINQSDKPIIGYCVQRITDDGVNPVSSVVLFHWVAAGKAIQPGQEQPFGLLAPFRPCGLGGNERTESTTLRYELKAVLFADGEFQGDDEIFNDFSRRISAVKNLAIDAQYDQNKHQTLAQYNVAALLKGLRNASQDINMLEAKMTAAGIILKIRDKKGEQEAEAAIGRLAALPEITKGGPKKK